MKWNKLSLSLLLLTIILLFFTSRAYQNQALSFHFVDEEDNIVLGSYLLKGEKLYSDLFSHHQPLAYIASAGVQKITNPNTLFLLIKRHREVVIAWSALWSVILVARFGCPLFLFTAIYEPLKIFLLGNLFLAESLVVYPLVYLISALLFLKKGLARQELIFLGFCFTLILWLLTPLWPILLFAFFIFLYKERLKKISWLLLGTIPLVLLAASFISLKDYWHNAFYINLFYYIPATSKKSILETITYAFISPFTSFFYWTGRSATLQITQLLTALLMISWLVIIKKGGWKLPSLMFVLLGLTNLRYVSLGQQEYSGFHLLPWFASLILISTTSAFLIWKKYSFGRVIKVIFVLIVTALIWVVIRESGQRLFTPHNIFQDFYIKYSRQEDFGRAIKIMKEKEEKLFVVPDEWLVYWQADIAHASKMVNYYAWMADVEEIKNPLHKMFSENPPTYFYCDRCRFGYFGLEEFFPKYQKIKKDGSETNLMVLKEKVKNINEEQKRELDYFRFTFE